MGMDPQHPTSVGSPDTVQGWFNGGWPREAIIAGVQKVMQSRAGDPPGTLKYFEKAIARAHAELTRVLPKVEIKPGEITTEIRTNGYRSGNTRTTGHDAILASAA